MNEGFVLLLPTELFSVGDRGDQGARDRHKCTFSAFVLEKIREIAPNKTPRAPHRRCCLLDSDAQRYFVTVFLFFDFGTSKDALAQLQKT